jgi:hypothetical protein
VLYVRDGTATVIDPLVPPGDDARWAFLDENTAGSRVRVALTAPWHRRSAAQVADRYRAEVLIEGWLRGLERLPVELVLPTHGPPAPRGRAAIRDALSRPPLGPT